MAPAKNSLGVVAVAVVVAFGSATQAAAVPESPAAATQAAAVTESPAAAQAGAAVDLRLLGALGPLAELAIQRIQVSDQVAASKFGTGQPIDDPVRERQELDAVRKDAVGMGLDPATTVRFFQDQITASKVVQDGLFRRWEAHPDRAPVTRPDLDAIRTRLDRLTTQILQELERTQDVRHATWACALRLAGARLSGELLYRLDGLHRRALSVALRSVCSPA